MDTRTICLNIQEYSIDELINLFKLPKIHHITQEHMKEARKIVMTTHPDKSGLDKEYFQFYVKAYERLIDVVNYYNRTSQKESSYLEKHRNIEKEIDKQAMLYTSLKKAGVVTDNGIIGKNWNKWKAEFDEWFEKNSELITDNEGYEDFLRSTSDLLPEGATEAEARAFMERRKNTLSALVVKEDVYGIDSWNSFGGKQRGGVGSTYGEDIRKAYTETVVPVTEDDFKNRRQYSSMDEYKRERHNQLNNMDYEEGNQSYYKEKALKERAELSEYLKQLNITERKKEEVDKFKSRFLRLLG